jgi:tetratricopeptide (TPR) repeat protein
MTLHALISHTGSKPVPFFQDAWEPAFFDCNGKLCPELPDPALCERYLAYLHHRILRNPRDLLAHTRRVMLALAGNQQALVYAALTDLFTALGEKGADLRAGLLEKCRPVLTLEQAQALLDEPHASQGSPLVARHLANVHAVALSVLEEVRELLENGQVELAQNMLEQALPQDQDNLELTQELLEIYRRSRNRDAALRTLASLPWERQRASFGMTCWHRWRLRHDNAAQDQPHRRQPAHARYLVHGICRFGERPLRIVRRRDCRCRHD